MKTWAVITGTRKYDLELQIMVHSLEQAKKEVKELKRDYGCDDARFREFESEDAAYAWVEKNS